MSSIPEGNVSRHEKTLQLALCSRYAFYRKLLELTWPKDLSEKCAVALTKYSYHFSI